jgi:hypothetical protein
VLDLQALMIHVVTDYDFNSEDFLQRPIGDTVETSNIAKLLNMKGKAIGRDSYNQ